MVWVVVFPCVGEVRLERYRVGSGDEFRPQVRVNALSANDVDTNSAYFDFNVLVDHMASRTNETLRAAFASDFSIYTNGSFYTHPTSIQSNDANVVVGIPLKPWQYDQDLFQDWFTNSHPGTVDFRKGTERRFNDYTGALQNPVVFSSSEITSDFLKQTFGKFLHKKQDSIVAVSDGRYDPDRWLVPCNEILHKETGAIMYWSKAKYNEWDNIVSLFGAWRDSGIQSTNIYLEYEVDIEVSDYSQLYSETSPASLYNGLDPQDSGSLTGAFDYNLKQYGMLQRTNVHGGYFNELLQKKLAKIYTNRFDHPFAQVSLSVMFREREGKFREADFMLLNYGNISYNVKPSETSTGQGFHETANLSLNSYITDGGNSGNVGWWRVPVDLLASTGLIGTYSALRPVVSGCNHYTPDFSTNNVYTVTAIGKIDLTKFYRLAHLQSFFPGQKGYWVNKWVGFRSGDPDTQDFYEGHGIERVGIIVEHHGLNKVKCEIKKLDFWMETASVTSNGTPYAWLDSYYNNLETDADYENAANTDTDGDGFVGGDEFLTGTDPADPLSLFSLTASVEDLANFVVTWPSLGGNLYSLSSSTNLVTPTRGLDVSNIVGQADTTSYTGSLDHAASFYKVSLD